MELVIYEDNLVFTNEIWTEIYETIKKYFTNVEIVGWSIIRAGLPLNVDERVKKVHVDNFAGQDKTLLLYDSLEREEAFYVFEDNKLKRQDGYYIFYDKNAEMQNYIITLREEHETAKPYSIPRRPKVVSDSGDIDKTVSRVMPRKKSGIMYGVGTAAAVVVLVFSAATLNNYDTKSRQDSKTINVLSENVHENDNSEIVTTVKSGLPVDTAKGKLSTINNDDKSDGKIKKSTQHTDNESKEQANNNTDNKKAVNKKAKNSPSPVPKKTEQKQDTKPVSKTNNYYIVKRGDSLSSIAVRLYHTRSYINKINVWFFLQLLFKGGGLGFK